MESFGLSVALLVAALCLGSSHAALVTVDAVAEVCFHDKVALHTKMGLTFEVSEGGFLDIDVKITGPDGREIYAGTRETNGKYTFSADQEGIYTYCFSNKMSTMTPKTVMFSMDIGDSKKSDDTNDHHNQLEEMVAQLSTALMAVKHEQDYMEVRERIHRMINDNTNSRVAWWAFFEDFILISMTLGQIYYLKRFFEVRRVV